MAVVPIFVVVIGWGYRANRLQAALYMFLYTFLASIPFLVFLLYFQLGGYSFIFSQVFYSFFNGLVGSFFWFIFCLVFIVKLPIFFFHLWLPKAHVEAPLLGSIILAGVLLKLGGYGLFKIIEFSYQDFLNLTPILGAFFLIGGCVIGFICIRQIDLKSLVAYSSVVHIAPTALAIFLVNYYGVLGSIMIIFSHGLCSSCLFFILNLSYAKLMRRRYLLNRGGLFFLPFFSFIWLLFCVTNMGFPPTFSFFSELFIIVEVFSYSYFFLFFVFLIMLLRGFYRIMLYIFYNHGGKKFFFNFLLSSIKDNIVVLLSLFYLFLFVFYFLLVLCF